MKNLIIILTLSTLIIACKETSTNSTTSDKAIKAFAKLTAVNSSASAFKTGLLLMAIQTDSITKDGRSMEWCYEYMDTSAMLPIVHCFNATYSSVKYGGTTAYRMDQCVITRRFFNSDLAMYFAEYNGGWQFRATHSQVTIQAHLGQDLSVGIVTSWWIIYRANDNSKKYLALEIDSQTGALLMRQEN